MTTQSLTVGNVAIRAHNGLYALNDLHRASGGEEKHQPNRFLRLDTTQALIGEISKTPYLADYKPIETTRGRYASTYACRELVIAYASWISAAFHLKVLQVFLDTAAPAPEPAAPAIEAPAASATEQAITEIIQSAAQRIADTLREQPPQVQWREVIRAVKQQTVDISFPELTDLASACLKRLQGHIGSEAYSAISQRAAQQGVSTMQVSLHA